MDPPRETEVELEAFRKQWQDEVSKRGNNTGRASAPQPAQSSSSKPEKRKAPPKHAHARSKHDGDDDQEEEKGGQVDAQTHHDLPNKEAELRLDAADHGLVRGSSSKTEPKSALEHYERAVEKETQGSLGDSLKHYRRAFKLDDGVHEQYKKKHFPPSSFPPKRPTAALQKHAQANPSNASATVPSTAHHSSEATPSLSLPQDITQLLSEFSHLSVVGAPPPTDADPPPPCPIAELPGELLTDILTYAAIYDLSSLSRISQVCKRFAYLVMTDEQIWRRISQGDEYGFNAMNYDYVCDLYGKPLPEDDNDYSHVYDAEDADCSPSTPKPLVKTTPEIDLHLLQNLYRSSWRQLFRLRPRLRFNGCYISTVNYTRPGAASTDTRTWGTPIHIVTYFRYLRFFRDGTCISLLTTTEPVDVVHQLTKENLNNRKYHHGSNLPSAVMKDGLSGRWRLSGPGDGSADDAEAEKEGEVHVETEGVVPKYMWKMQFSIGNASTRGKTKSGNGKLSWVGFWSYNKLTDDWGEFGLKNDKPYWFSRVKGYGMG